MRPEEQSPTPRTDAEQKYDEFDCGLSASDTGNWISSDFARQLERELNEAKSEIARLERELSESNFLAIQLGRLLQLRCINSGPGFTDEERHLFAKSYELFQQLPIADPSELVCEK